MNIIINAVFPTVLLLILGNIFRRTEFLPVNFWASLDKLTYFILFPALLVAKVSQVDLSIVNFSHIFAFIGGYFAIISLIAYGIFRLAGTSANQFSSIYQGVLRFNTYIFFAIIEARWGTNTLALAALFSGIVIPFVNICCVTSFSLGNGRFSLGKTLRSIASNPLILAALLGFLMNVFPQLLPTVVLSGLDILGKAALPLALLSVGAAIRIKMLWKRHDDFTRLSLWLGTLTSLLLAPAIAYAIAVLLGVHADLRYVLVLFAAVPTATSSYILAKQLGGHTNLITTLISLQTVLSIFSLTVWLLILS